MNKVDKFFAKYESIGNKIVSFVFVLGIIFMIIVVISIFMQECSI